jgi:hypothetical protein
MATEPGRRVEDRRVAVGVGEAGRQVLAGQPLDLGQHVACAVGVELREGALAEDGAGVEDFEQVELDVTQVALVVPHGRLSWLLDAGLPASSVQDALQW